MELVWLFGEARSRQRKRRRRVAWSLAGLLTCVIVIRVATGNGAPTANPQPTIPMVPPSAVFAQAPYLGVHCPVANSIACDQVGLAIWLRRPAVRVRGTIAGEPLVLDWFGEERRVGPRPARRELTGYLRRAHIATRLGAHPGPGGMWFGPIGANWPAPLVRLTITFADGHRVVTQLRVPLQTGWG